MEEATVQFVDGVGGLVKPVYELSYETYFPTIIGVPYSVCCGSTSFHKLMVFPVQPLSGGKGLVALSTFPTLWPFDGNSTRRELFFTPIATAGGGNGDAFLKGIKLCFFVKFLDEGFTSSFEEFYIRFAIGFHVVFEVEDVVSIYFFGVPLKEVGAFFG